MYVCFRKALTVRPLHPEARGLMAEILGLTGAKSYVCMYVCV